MSKTEEALPPRRFAELCALLPEGVQWGDPLTPQLAGDIVRAALAQRQQVLVAPAANIAGAALLPTRSGSGWVSSCGCVGSEQYVNGELVRSEYKCPAHAAPPAQQQSAQPEQQPVGHLHSNGDFCQERAIQAQEWPIPLYATQPRAVEPLTDEQIDKIEDDCRIEWQQRHPPHGGGAYSREALRIFARSLLNAARGIGKQEQT